MNRIGGALVFVVLLTAQVVSPPDRERLMERKTAHTQRLVEVSRDSAEPVVLLGPAINLLDGLDPWTFPNRLSDLRLLPISTWTSWYTSQRKNVSDYCGSLDFTAVFEKLRTARTVLVTDSASLETIKAYALTFYGTSLAFAADSETATFEELSYGRKLNRYAVTSVTKGTRNGE